MDIKIINAGVQDADTLGLLISECWRQAYAGIIPDDYLKTVTPEKRAERFRTDIPLNPDVEYDLIFVDTQPAGLMILMQCRDEDLPDAGDLTAIYFLSPYWGKGLGQAAIEYALQWFQSASYKQAVIWVLAENQRARKFYEKNGFYLDGAKKTMDFGKELSVVRYRRDL